jgi:hypothetical protein
MCILLLLLTRKLQSVALTIATRNDLYQHDHKVDQEESEPLKAKQQQVKIKQ